MAQETAGTIGIPVYKNEVLPALEAFARRRERAELYKRKAEQRAAELEAKKAEELNKYVPPAFEIAKGNYWQPAIKKRMESEQIVALQRIKDAKTTAEKAKAAQDYNAVMQELNYGGEIETQKQKENLKSLKESGINVDENALAQYYTEQAKTNPDFFATNHIVNFKEWAKSQPEKYISPAMIGTSLLKQYEPISIGIKGKKEGEKFTYNPLFEPEKVKDQLTGVNIYKADKPNLVKIQEALEANPNLREAADAYIDPIAARVMKDNPGMSSTEAYTLAAGEFFGKALPQGRAKETYDYSEVGPKKGGTRAGGKTPVNIETRQPATRSVDIATYEKVGDDAVEKGRQQITIGNPKTDVEYTYSRSYKLNPNIPVYLMQSPEDIYPNDPSIKDSYIKSRTDGRYTMKTGFEYTNPVKSTVYFADRDIKFVGKNPPQTSYTIAKGTPLDNETALNLIRQGRSKEVKREVGYEVTAEMLVPYETTSGSVTERKKPSIKIFIPEGNAASIKRHIDMEKQKANSFQAAIPQGTETFKIFED